jgi:predicted GIY-YIG superfamily endonuclease
MRDEELPGGPGAYVVHLHQPIRHARNYTGSAKNIAVRIGEHRAGTGAKLLAEANRRGIGWHVARLWPTQTHEEAWQIEIGLKNRRDSPAYCPGCTPGTTEASRPTRATRRTARRHPPVRRA